MKKNDLLATEFEELKKLKFPSEPKGLDVIAELAEADGYIAGNVSTFLAGKIPDFELKGLDEDIKKNIREYSPVDSDDEKEWNYLRLYLEKMESLNSLLKDAIKESDGTV